MKPKSPFVNFILVVLVCAAAVTAVEWYDWLTDNICLTTGQTAIVITTAVMTESGKAWLLWNKCWKHYPQERADQYGCATEVISMIARWGVELTALGVITGWFKRDEGDTVTLGGTPIILIDDFRVVQTKRGLDSQLDFSVGNETFSHLSKVYGESEQYQLALLGHGSVSATASIPLMALEVSDGGVVLSPFMPSGNVKRDGVDSNLYVSGHGSVVAECQYGGGISGTDFSSLYDMVLRRGKKQLTTSEYFAFHGYVSSDSRMKCAAKVYNDDESFGSWRNWDDVWSSF